VPARLAPALLAGLALLIAPSALTAQTIHHVNAGGDLQAALNAAQPGDIVSIEAGARFVGTFRLPSKAFGPVITVRSSAALPDRRVTPADAPLMPTLSSGGVESALSAIGTSNWRIEGLNFESTTTGEGNVVALQDATNIVLDRILLVAGPAGQKRGVMGNGQHITLTRSHIANIWRSGQDSQAFCAWDGAGPYAVTDNYLEAASENIMFGGANSQSADRVPADILVEGNHLSKRLEWKGEYKNVKNLFELKSAKRVVVRNNLMERNWPDGQNGYGILFTVRNDEGDSPWSVIEDVLFENNIVRDTTHGINVLGYDSYQPSGRTTRVTVRNNLIITSGTFLQLGSEIGELVIDHNTVVNGGTFAFLYYGDVWLSGTGARRKAQFAVESLQLTNTVGYHNSYGVIGDGVGIGIIALDTYALAYRWTHNVLAGGGGYTYPDTTWRPSIEEHKSQFNADYTLIDASWYRGAATEGLDLGANWANSEPAPVPEPAPEPEPEPEPSGPFSGTPVSLPGTVEAEDYDLGSTGVAYYDVTAGNSGGRYRATDVDIEASTEGGYNVGWMSVGEWLTYTVNVASAGTYDLEFRLASKGGGGTFHLKADGVDKTGPIGIPDTGGWQNWTTVTRTGVSFAAGQQVLRFVADAAGPTGAVANLNWIRAVAVSNPTPAPIAIVTTSPLVDGVVGQPYELTLTATRTGKWRVTGGALPEGLTLAVSGLIAGTPTKQGIYTVAVEVSDGSSTATATFSLRIRPRAPSAPTNLRIVSIE
jgi:hypothetical protein